MNFTAFDTSKIDEYAKQAKEYWGDTPEFKEFEAKEKKEKQRGKQKMLHQQLMLILQNLAR